MMRKSVCPNVSTHVKSWNLAVVLDLFVPLVAGRQLLRLQAITPKEENLHKFSVCTQLHLAISASHLSKSISYDQWPTEAAIYFALSARPLVNFTATVAGAMLLAPIATVENPTNSEQARGGAAD